jgi:Resolvase, N terminal domain
MRHGDISAALPRIAPSPQLRLDRLTKEDDMAIHFNHTILSARDDRASATFLAEMLMVTRLDRLARSTRDLLNILDAVAKAGAGFKSLGDT